MQRFDLIPARPTRPLMARRAFTLIEVLLVIVIIGMLATVLVVTIGGQQEGAAIDTTKIKVQKVATKVNEYQLAMGAFPTEADGGLKALVERPADEEAGKPCRPLNAAAFRALDMVGQVRVKPIRGRSHSRRVGSG